MTRYYFYDYKDKNGNHEVHEYSCSFLPSIENRTFIGNFSSCHAAIRDAENKYPSLSFDGCYFCSEPCHHG